jgi:putative glutamine amidotransferase
MPKPIIGITVGRQNPATAQNEIQMPITGCPLSYVQAVVRSAGAPVLLARTDDQEALTAMLGVVQGLILSGGGDILSLAWGEEPHPQARFQDPVRDRMELEATRIAFERRLPILGICRGIQTLNVALGGTLIQDIPAEVPKAGQHFSHEREIALVHTIDIQADSLLAKVLGATQMAVNSWHHQAVRDVPASLRVSARARDGVIEGLEAADGRPALAVQFHPEECCGQYPVFQRLFDWLVTEAGKCRARS